MPCKTPNAKARRTAEFANALVKLPINNII
jgi:hypothetical protein